MLCVLPFTGFITHIVLQKKKQSSHHTLILHTRVSIEKRVRNNVKEKNN